MFTYALGSLYFLPSIIGRETSLGLQGGTLYDVLDNTTVSSGSATVNATGFNVTCGYTPDTELRMKSDDGSNYWTNPTNEYTIFSTRKLIRLGVPGMFLISVHIEPGIIAKTTDGGDWDSTDSIVLYSTIPIVDSSGKNGSWAKLIPPMNTSVSSIQVFQCSLSLVNQTAMVDAQSGKIQTVGPNFKKDYSTWMPYTAPLNTTSGNLLIDSVRDSLPSPAPF